MLEFGFQAQLEKCSSSFWMKEKAGFIKALKGQWRVILQVGCWAFSLTSADFSKSHWHKCGPLKLECHRVLTRGVSWMVNRMEPTAFQLNVLQLMDFLMSLKPFSKKNHKSAIIDNEEIIERAELDVDLRLESFMERTFYGEFYNKKLQVERYTFQKRTRQRKAGWLRDLECQNLKKSVV